MLEGKKKRTEEGRKKRERVERNEKGKKGIKVARKDGTGE